MEFTLTSISFSRQCNKCSSRARTHSNAEQCFRKRHWLCSDFRHKISFSWFFCACVKLLGNLTLTSTIISPRSAGFLLFGIPRCGNVSLKPGPVGPPPETGTCLPSIVEIVRLHPVNASLRSSSTVARRLSSSRTKTGCGFYSSNQHRYSE